MTRSITLAVDVPGDRTEPGKLVRMRVTEEYAEIDLGHTAQTWALTMERLSAHVGTGLPNPFFPAVS